MIPASSLKLITSFTALNVLGKHFRFETKVAYTGSIEYDGTLTGDIVILSSGDPCLGSPDFKGVRSLDDLIQSIVTNISKKGIKCIEGKLIIHNNLFKYESPPDSWQWNDIGNYYAGGVYGLNVHDNYYRVFFERDSRIGNPAKIIDIQPRIPEMRIDNQVTIAAAGTGDRAYIYGGPWARYKKILGTIPRGKSAFSIKGSIPDPPLFFGHILAKAMKEKSIEVSGVRVSQESIKEKYNDIYTYKSPHLERIVYMCNIESNNLYAEALLKKFALEKCGAGDYESSIMCMRAFLESKALKSSDYRAVDGSGLSRENYISSQLMCSFLDTMSKEMGIEALCKLMARPGKKGTAEQILNNSPARENIWIKTGSMSSVQSYSGFIQSRDGQWYSFCIIANAFEASNGEVRRQFDAFISDIYSYL